MLESSNYSSPLWRNCHEASPEMHRGEFLHFIAPCFFLFFFPLQVLMSVVLHYAVPPGFNLASGSVGLTPKLVTQCLLLIKPRHRAEWVQAWWELQCLESCGGGCCCCCCLSTFYFLEWCERVENAQRIFYVCLKPLSLDT